jgi:hypothetical protein
MSAATDIKFRQIMFGLYGTGIYKSDCFYSECSWGCDENKAEVQIDHFTDVTEAGNPRGWYIRYRCECGNFTSALGEWFETLRDAKAYIRATEVK